MPIQSGQNRNIYMKISLKNLHAKICDRKKIQQNKAKSLHGKKFGTKLTGKKIT